MLRMFPGRKMLFVPQAVCKTQVPAEFQVLLSQRRRWINSTIHNMFELVLVRNLCGIFCFSMQFVIALELFGTLTLPAAITFTTTVLLLALFKAILQDAADYEMPETPLLLLAIILGLPAVLIVMTTRRMIYVWYMTVYLFALPVWNFVLPTYAWWHFDDFSWGQTRQVAGEKKGGDAHGHGEGGACEDPTLNIPRKRWARFEKERRQDLMDRGEPDPVGVISTLSDCVQKSSTAVVVAEQRKGLAKLFRRKKKESVDITSNPMVDEPAPPENQSADALSNVAGEYQNFESENPFSALESNK
jgi:hypothetical protein